MFNFKKLISTVGIIPLLSIALLSSGCSLLDASVISKTDAQQSGALSVDERAQKVTALLKETEQLIVNGTSTQHLQLSETKLNEIKAHLEYLPTSYTTTSVEVERKSSRRRRSSSKRSRSRTKHYDVDVETETVYDDKYAHLRAKAEDLNQQLENKKEWVTENVARIGQAKQYAFAAAKASQKPPHPVETWEAIEQFWYKATNELERINQGEPGYAEAQKLLPTYQNNLKVIQYRMQLEANATDTLDDIYNRAESLAQSPPTDRESYILELQDLIKQLKTIKPGTTAYTDAQKLMVSAQKRLKS
ncbi:hypothetical protein DSM106972_082930 [Dulcicalothrix desertica PCC 7102]|uniref:Lipoprotein n=1 Tax=Dulcicalothrix desertica PCC 7102 TaxID=232991 RepID=A0A433UUR4_9CYAN|nr:hypothetical protein [Dulcicalothrix desertica]RUS97556.1 hypothetical protein DSM106972_082930 [Dulcicalothrix desertica PCC 7102]TWH54765.1 hypothetical protein CAL7102_02833 [Dulcicalothrix desertica PCC 7102]